MKKELRKQQALDYHSNGRPGKIEVVPTKDAKTQRDLSLAYSPGVAEPCIIAAGSPWRDTSGFTLPDELGP